MQKRQTGFTLIELVVTLGIMILLTSILLVYSRAGEQRIILFKEQAKVISTIMRAKSLAVQTFAEEVVEGMPPICGYGIHFESPDTFFIFKDLSDDCNNPVPSYDPYKDEIFEGKESQLDSNLKFFTLELTDILFIPPDPKVKIVSTITAPEKQIIISTLDGTANATIKVNNAGQITTQ